MRELAVGKKKEVSRLRTREKFPAAAFAQRKQLLRTAYRWYFSIRRHFRVQVLPRLHHLRESQIERDIAEVLGLLLRLVYVRPTKCGYIFIGECLIKVPATILPYQKYACDNTPSSAPTGQNCG